MNDIQRESRFIEMLYRRLHVYMYDCAMCIFVTNVYGARTPGPSLAPAIKPALCTYLPNQHNTTFIPEGPQGSDRVRVQQCVVPAHSTL
jgi:hypothetical protein